jgi:hypothetical protein
MQEDKLQVTTRKSTPVCGTRKVTSDIKTKYLGNKQWNLEGVGRSSHTDTSITFQGGSDSIFHTVQ